MSNTIQYPDETSMGDDRPLPMIVAEQWGFSLYYVFEDDKTWYSIRDWVIGLTGANDP